MTQFKGTKGKWEVVGDIIGTQEEDVCEVFVWDRRHYNQSYNDVERFKANSNALLISKAPEMLEMLQKLKEDFLLKTDLRSEGIADMIGELIKEATEL